MRKKLMVVTAMLMAGSLFAAGCAQQGAAEGESSSTEVQYQNSIEEAEAYLDGVNERQDELNKEYAPEIRTLEDGTKVQRTPTEYQCYHWNRPYEGGTSYNNYYLDADNRGCGACHEDLGDALANMEYSHPTVWNDALGSKITVDQCMLCHSADDGYEMGTVMQENLSKRILVRSLGATGYRKQKLHETQEKLFKLGMEQIKFSTFTQGVMGITFGGGYLCAFLWGIFQLHNHEITFGTMTAFLQLVGQVQGPFLGLISIPPSLVRGWTSVERLMALFEDVEPDEHPVYIDQPLTLDFREVSFGYEEGQPVLDRFTATFHPGNSTAIAGPTGTGKTTIIRLILALVYPEKGRIDLTTDDGRTLSVTPDLRINFVYVPQGNTLLSGTIRENLWLGSPGVDEETLHKVIRLACAEFVFSLPEGLDTRIGEHGYGLSEGQAQRIAIARALLRPGRIWLFDEASSALDTGTTTRLMDNLLQWGKNNTLIFVTHDPRLMERCDQVIHIKE